MEIVYKFGINNLTCCIIVRTTLVCILAVSVEFSNLLLLTNHIEVFYGHNTLFKDV